MSELVFDDVSVRFGGRRHAVHAVDRVSLTVPSGAIVGLVGESGSGKTTLGRCAVGLSPVNSGRVLLDSRPVSLLRRSRINPVQMIFQDPSSALDPRMRVGDSVAEALPRGLTRLQRRVEIGRLLELVQLEARQASAFPAHLSGGQRQRVALARALAARPEVIIADEITSALDVSIQGTVINVLRDLQAELGFGVLFISHNLPLVRYMASEIAVMHRGRIVEHGATLDVLASPRDDYTRTLIGAVPDRPGAPSPRSTS